MEATSEVNVTEENSAEAPHFKRKENDQAVRRADSSNVLESPAPAETDWPEQVLSLRSPETFMETLAGRNVNYNPGSQSESEPPCTSPRSSNDPGMMVEELTLKNYKKPNLSIVGCSSSGEELPVRKGMWQNLKRLAGGTGDALSKESSTIGDRVGVGNMFLPQPWLQRSLPRNQLDQNYSKVSEHLAESDNRIGSSNAPTRLPGGIRTKVLQASGFPQFLVKNTLKGKGVTYRQPGNGDVRGAVIRGENNRRGTGDAVLASDSSHRSSAKVGDVSLFGGGNGGVLDLHHGGIRLRDWLKPRRHKLNKCERLHIFKQILELVDTSHSQGLALQQLKPSCFMIFPSNEVKYVGSFVPEGQMELPAGQVNQDIYYLEHHLKRKKLMVQGNTTHEIFSPKHQKLGEHMNLGSRHHILPGRVGLEGPIKEIDTGSFKAGNSGGDFREQLKFGEEYKPQNMSGYPTVSSTACQQSISEIMKLEEDKWYASPEELNESAFLFSSNIYSLGVLLFELFCYFQSREVHSAAMSDLHHRILPPIFLSESPKEAGFCLWLLHPEPSSRPKSRDILLSELIREGRGMSALDDPSASLDEEDAEAELLLHFLLSLKEQKEKQAAKLVKDLGCLKVDVEEVERRHSLRAEFLSNARGPLANINDISGVYPCKGPISLETMSRFSMSGTNEVKLTRNIDQLENAYYSVRSQIELPEANAAARSDIDVLKIRDRFSPVQNNADLWCANKESTDRLGAFFEGFCKYARFKKFEVCGSIRNVDILNSANVICSLSFDRDEDYFAAAGVSKKIKIFEFDALLNNDVDIHYPVIEMSSKSKLSCVCWNNYIKNYLASTDYDGVIQLWDASTGQGFTQYIEHQKRAWSVDFSQVDPTKLASGSDDCSVKLWSINEKKCIDTIRNVANVCCVQFSPHSSHLLAFGSADYKVYCYDLRNTRIPWCTLAGYGKAVSYVKFVDPETLVSASTDNTLKLWDLNKTSASGLSTSACSLTFTGHTNEKNFVGLSVSDGYISCGSETNEVYSYYRTLPMPIASHKFGSIDPITGQETGDDNGQFVSSVCWRGKSSMVVSANSSGSIKLLQMV